MATTKAATAPGGNGPPIINQLQSFIDDVLVLEIVIAADSQKGGCSRCNHDEREAKRERSPAMTASGHSKFDLEGHNPSF